MKEIIVYEHGTADEPRKIGTLFANMVRVHWIVETSFFGRDNHILTTLCEDNGQMMLEFENQ